MDYRLGAALAGAIDLLTRAGFGHALIGGLAVSTHCEPRFTRDVDLVVDAQSDDETEAVVRAFVAGGWQVAALMEQDDMGRIAAVRVVPASAGLSVVVDLLFASSGLEPELVDRATPIELLPGLTVPISQPGHLIALKLLSRDDRRRPQDAVDLRALLAVADEEQLALARHSLDLIQARGYHRGRSLQAALHDLLQSD